MRRDLESVKICRILNAVEVQAGACLHNNESAAGYFFWTPLHGGRTREVMMWYDYEECSWYRTIFVTITNIYDSENDAGQLMKMGVWFSKENSMCIIRRWNFQCWSAVRVVVRTHSGRIFVSLIATLVRKIEKKIWALICSVHLGHAYQKNYITGRIIIR